MRKIPLTIIGCYLSLLAAFAQPARTDSTAPAADSTYVSRKLKPEEVNFVSSYYMQDGNHSAVTGGIGTEHLTDFANTIDLKMSKTDHDGKLHTLLIEAGIDSYTSASSDRIDPTTISSASSSDTRYYPSASYTIKNTHNLTSGGSLYISKEYDYTSLGTGAILSKATKDNNRELGVKLLAYFDTWRIILPIELRGSEASLGIPGNTHRNSYTASFSYSQVVNERLQVAALLDIGYQQGLLSTLYQRIYFKDNSLGVEHLPNTRLRIPVGFRAHYFLGDRFIIRAFYRYYTDDWGLNAHTASLEVPVKITPTISLSPFYRYYTQTAIKYFAPYRQHSPTERFYSSDYDMSKFDSHMTGLNVRLVAAGGILGIKRWNTLDVRYSHYYRTTDLQSDVITLAAKFK
jgi:hypothetical protein